MGGGSSFFGGVATVLLVTFAYAEAQDPMCGRNWPFPLCSNPPQRLAEPRAVATPQLTPAPIELEPPVFQEVGAPAGELSEKPEEVAVLDFSTQRPEPPAPVLISEPQWIDRPSQREVNRYYPSRALELGEEGRVLLECIAAPDGRIACVVMADENPQFGFGDAALRVSRRFRVAPVTRDGEPTPGGRLELPIRFNISSNR